MSSISKPSLNPYSSTVSVNNRARVEVGLFALPQNWVLWMLSVPMLVALGISGYLTYASMTASEIAGCSGSELFDCGHVVNSKWSKFLGIPVSLMAVATYGGMLLATMLTASKKLSTATRQWGWTIVTALAMAAALAGLYFIFLQVFVLEHLCPWCLGAHSCGLLIALVVLTFHRVNPSRLFGAATFAAAGLILMATAQINAKEPPKYVIETYVPIEVPADHASATYVSDSPDSESDLFMSPVDDEEDLFAPPSEDEDLFAPPVDDETIFAPPTEDASDVSYKAIKSQLSEAKGLALMFASLRVPAINVAVLQQEGSAKKAATQAEGSEKKGSQAKKEEPAQKRVSTKPPVKKEKRIVSFLGGRQKLNAHDWPLVGDPNAKHIFIEMFDYTCSHCRSTTKALFEAKKKLGDDVAVIVLPVPLNRACNSHVTQDHADHVESCQLSKLAVAVWRCDRNKFSEFHMWMFEGEKSPIYQDALAKANELVGSEVLKKELSKSISDRYLKLHVQLYQKVGAGAVPKLLFPATSVVGEFTGVDALVSVIQENTGK